MLFQVMAVIVLMIFYGIYFTKMLMQRRKGIQTNQLIKGKLNLIELLMTVSTVSIVIIQLGSIIINWSLLPSSARFTGFILSMMGNSFFLISVVTMKDSWRAGIPTEDQTELVSEGIYKYSRNPAFVGFDLMYIGMCLLFCNILMIIFTIFTIIMLDLQIRQEEKYLVKRFGDKYLKYRQSVRRYL